MLVPVYVVACIATLLQVLHELSADGALSKYRGSYERLYAAVRTSVDTEARLTNAVHALEAEVASQGETLLVPY